MINANELRIGNYIRFKNADLKLHIACASDISAIEQNISSFTPIEITEKFLVDNGFQLHCRNINFYTHPNLPIQIRFSKRHGCQMRISHFKKGEWRIFKYVHLLQNLYFFLVGEEFVFQTEP